MIKRIVIIVAFLALSIPLSAQRFAIGTNFVDWASLGTINAEGAVAVSKHITIHIGAELNPWTWGAGNQSTQFQARQNSYWAGARWWPWHVYSGWWAGLDGRYSVYNIGGLFKKPETEEGDAYGVGIYGGYSIMLNAYWNLDLGIGGWGGWTNYKRYSCPLCGVRTDEGTKGFFIPDARIALQFIF